MGHVIDHRMMAQRDADRLTALLTHMEKGHSLSMYLVDGEVTVLCDTGECEVALHRLCKDPFSADTCVRDGETWCMTWKVEDTSLGLIRKDFKD